MKEHNEYVKMEADIINCFDHKEYTPAEVYMVLAVVKAEYVRRAFASYEEATNEHS